MAFPTLGTIDDFNRADGAPGANWTSGFFGDSNNIAIVSNSVLSAANAFGGASWNTKIGPDFELYVILARAFTAGSTEEIDLEIFDSQTSGSPNGFGAIAFGDSGPNANAFRLERIDAGTPTTLVTGASGGWSVGDGFGMSRVGTTVTLYQFRSGGSWSVFGSPQTDSHYATSLWPGMEFTSNLSSQAKVDTFGGGTLGGTTFTPPAPRIVRQAVNRASTY